MIGFIIFTCCSVLFAGFFSFNILLSIMIKSNKSGSRKDEFCQNTKQPMRIHVFSFSEYYKDMQENPEHYGVIQLL